MEPFSQPTLKQVNESLIYEMKMDSAMKTQVEFGNL